MNKFAWQTFTSDTLGYILNSATDIFQATTNDEETWMRLLCAWMSGDDYGCPNFEIFADECTSFVKVPYRFLALTALL